MFDHVRNEFPLLGRHQLFYRAIYIRIQQDAWFHSHSTTALIGNVNLDYLSWKGKVTCNNWFIREINGVSKLLFSNRNFDSWDAMSFDWFWLQMLKFSKLLLFWFRKSFAKEFHRYSARGTVEGEFWENEFNVLGRVGKVAVE